MNISPINTQPSPTGVSQSTSVNVQDLRQTGNTQKPSASNVSERAVSQTDRMEASREALEKATKDMNDFVSPINSAIQFALDEDTGTTVVKVIDVATKDVIRQIPSEEMLSIAKAIDKVKGLLVHQKA